MATRREIVPAGETSPPGTGGGPGPWERLLFVLLCAGVVVYWALQYQPFVLPNNDYGSFEDTARSLAALELPRSFQRMPVLPALMGVLAPLIPGRHPYLHAALLLNLGFSLALLALVFRLGARGFGRGALLPPLLLASTTQFHGMALQPLVEPSLACFAALAFVLLQARSPWQYAAAFAAGLSRYEAVILIPVLFVTNVVSERRLWRHVGLAALAASGFVGWTALGWLHGSGGTTYYDLMQGMGFRPAPDFFERSFKEPFRGWYREPGEGLWIFLVAIGVPLAVGVHAGLRELRRVAFALLAFFAGCVSVIVIFGINKARYVFPTEWIPLFFFSLGALRSSEAGARALARAPVALTALLAVLAAGAGLFVARRWALRILATAGAQPAWLDIGFAAFALALLAAWLAPAALRRPRPACAAAALALLAVATPQIAGGLHAKRKELFKVMYENWGSYVAAGWLERQLAPGERAVVVSPGHVQHLTGFGDDRVVGYAALRAESLEDLRRQMRARGVRYALYTWRKTPETPADLYYHRKLGAPLGEAFRSGGPVPGFVHLATLPLPEMLHRDPVQVYRLADEAPE
jgi:hypothetical protein